MRKTVNRLATAVVSFITLATFVAVPLAAAAGQTCVWTGAGGDEKFSTATNWSSCGSAAPQAGDTISFGSTSYGSGNSHSLTNDLGVTLAGVIADYGSSTNQNYYDIDTISLSSGATITETPQIGSGGSTSVGFTNLTDSGNLTLTGSALGLSGTSTWSVSGSLTVADTGYFTGSLTAGSLVVQNGGSVSINGSATTNSFAAGITLGGGSGTKAPSIFFSGGSSSLAKTWNVSSAINLLADSTVGAGFNTTVNITGAVTGSGLALTADQNNTGTLTISPSSNTSATVAGTFQGTGGGSGADDSTTATAAKTPNTGFALVSAHPVAIAALTLALTGALFFTSRRAFARAGVRN